MSSREEGGRLPVRLVEQIRQSILERPAVHRPASLEAFRTAVNHSIAHQMIAEGVDSQRAFSRADVEARRRAELEVPAIEHFMAADPAIVDALARDELDRARRRLRRQQVREREAGLRQLKSWGVLGTSIKQAKARHRERAGKQQLSFDLAAEQRRIIAEEVPSWDWPSFEPFAPGLRGLVETNRNGTVQMWTLVADEPLTGAGGRDLDGLPPDRMVRAFGVARGSLSEAMLLRRGFIRSRFPWRGLRRGDQRQRSSSFVSRPAGELKIATASRRAKSPQRSRGKIGQSVLGAR